MGEALTMGLLQELSAQGLDPASKMKNMGKKRKIAGISHTLRSRLRFLRNEEEA